MPSLPILPIFRPMVFTPNSWEWKQAGNAGDTGGPGTAAHGTYTLGEDENGNLRVSLSPVAAAPGAPWDTFYFYNNVGYMEGLRSLSQQIGFNFPSPTELAACEAFEWEMEYCVDGDVWNCGWQYRPDTAELRIFKAAAQQWIAVNVMSVKAGWATSITTEHRIASDAETHVAVWVDGRRIPLNVPQAVVRGKWPKGTNYLHTAFQFDCKAAGAPFAATVLGGTVTAL